MFSLKDLFSIVEDKKQCLEFILHRLDNEIILFNHGELFLKKRKFHLNKCDRKICKFIAEQLIEQCEQKESGIVDCLIETEEKIDSLF